MATYTVNRDAVSHARKLIDAHQYVLESVLRGSPSCPSGGLMACQYRAAEWRHKAVELAAHELLQRLDATRA